MRSHSVGPKIYMRDSSSFFSWNRRLGSNLQPKKYIYSNEVEPQNTPNARPATSLLLAARAGGNVGKGIKNVQRQDSSQFTQDQRVKAISKVNLNEDNNKLYDKRVIDDDEAFEIHIYPNCVCANCPDNGHTKIFKRKECSVCF